MFNSRVFLAIFIALFTEATLSQNVVKPEPINLGMNVVCDDINISNIRHIFKTRANTYLYYVLIFIYERYDYIHIFKRDY